LGYADPASPKVHGAVNKTGAVGSSSVIVIGLLADEEALIVNN
jgi:hypothetical protein